MMTSIWVDGSCINSIGAWAIYCELPRHQDCCWAKDTTNNRMELQAIMRAIDWAMSQRLDDITIWSDSRYAQGVISGTSEIKRNQILVAAASKLINVARSVGMQIKFKWVQAHTGKSHQHDFVDQLAHDEARRVADTLGF